MLFWHFLFSYHDFSIPSFVIPFLDISSSDISSSGPHFPPGCLDPMDLCFNILDLFSCDAAVARRCARHCMLTLLTRQMSAAFACCGSWILSASFLLVPALFLLLYTPFLLVISFWLVLLLLMWSCTGLLVNVCLLVWCTVALRLLVADLCASWWAAWAPPLD
jgi:hypothetical protein